jgi:hypothetical protein
VTAPCRTARRPDKRIEASRAAGSSRSITTTEGPRPRDAPTPAVGALPDRPPLAAPCDASCLHDAPDGPECQSVRTPYAGRWPWHLASDSDPPRDGAGASREGTPSGPAGASTAPAAERVVQHARRTDQVRGWIPLSTLGSPVYRVNPSAKSVCQCVCCHPNASPVHPLYSIHQGSPKQSDTRCSRRAPHAALTLRARIGHARIGATREG